MNTGIHNACNLAWKMALVLKGDGKETLLDSYEAERRAVGEEVVARTTRSVKSQKLELKGRLADTQNLVSYLGGAWLENAMPDGPAQCRSAPTGIWPGVVNPGAIWQFATNSTNHFSPKTAFRHGPDEERDSKSGGAG
jgi:FAD binding domain